MNILNLPVEEWGGVLKEMGEPSYRGRQIARWIFKNRVTDLSLMTDLPVSARNSLASKLVLSLPVVRSVQVATDGTIKLAIGLVDGSVVESVLIPRKGRMTLCLSTQVGCGIGCKFCRTAEMGLIRNLDPSEILGQWILSARLQATLSPSPGMGNTSESPNVLSGTARSTDFPAIDHIVFMGMGEPLANLDALIPAIRTLTHSGGVALSPRRITVSTSGLPPKIRRLGEADLGVHLAISLTAPDDLLRQEIMPVGRVYPIKDILAACRKFPLKPREKITFEYVLLKGVNDAPDQARALGRLLAPFKSKVNLIPFNPFEGSSYSRPSDETVEIFGQILSSFRLTATVRRTMGKDIRAACGQLAWDEKTKEPKKDGEPILWKPIVRSF